MDGWSGGYAYFFPMDRVMVRQEISFTKMMNCYLNTFIF